MYAFDYWLFSLLQICIVTMFERLGLWLRDLISSGFVQSNTGSKKIDKRMSQFEQNQFTVYKKLQIPRNTWNHTILCQKYRSHSSLHFECVCLWPIWCVFVVHVTVRRMLKQFFMYTKLNTNTARWMTLKSLVCTVFYPYKINKIIILHNNSSIAAATATTTTKEQSTRPASLSYGAKWRTKINTQTIILYGLLSSCKVQLHDNKTCVFGVYPAPITPRIIYIDINYLYIDFR